MTIAGIGVTLAFKERLQWSLYVLALCLVPIFLTAFLIKSDVEGYVSSCEASEYIPDRSLGAMTVLTSKPNARGIRFFTNQNVAALDTSGKQFFSPHPIPILATDDQILSVLNSQPVTIGVIRKSSYLNILKICAKHYHVLLLKIIGQDYVVRIYK